MSKKNVVAIIGQMGSGKTTLADRLVKELNFQKKSFATPLKEIAVEILGRPINKEIDRPFLQVLSEPLKMDFESDLEYYDIYSNYCNLLMKLSDLSGIDENDIYRVISNYKSSLKFFTNQFLEMSSNSDFVVVDDMRFLEVEYKPVKEECNLFVVALNTDLEICKQRLIERDGSFKEECFEHASEQECLEIPYDWVVNNNSESDIKTLIEILSRMIKWNDFNSMSNLERHNLNSYRNCLRMLEGN